MVNYFSQFKSWIYEDIYDDNEDNLNLLQRCQFILIIHNKVWQFADFYHREIAEGEYVAIGSGSQAAMACSKLSNSIEEILTAVCEVDIYCSVPLNIKEIKI